MSSRYFDTAFRSLSGGTIRSLSCRQQ